MIRNALFSCFTYDDTHFIFQFDLSILFKRNGLGGQIHSDSIFVLLFQNWYCQEKRRVDNLHLPPTFQLLSEIPEATNAMLDSQVGVLYSMIVCVMCVCVCVIVCEYMND